jgi:cytochrome oxidase Cu insertion factor (SCO1/SenC/PrrC family)
VNANPNVDPGTPLHGEAAPDFSLVNQFGQHMSLSQFRGKVVVLAFADSHCTTVCPLTTAAMVAARNLLGSVASRVQLLGVDANPDATSVPDVRAYSRDHGMLNQWDFLTGSRAKLTAVWKSYNIAVQIQRGLIDHTPALYVIDGRGREQMLYLTQLAYASIGQSAQIIAQEIARLLPGHPRLTHTAPESYIPGIAPTSRIVLPAVGGGPQPGAVTLGPGHARLLVFFTTWLRETSDLRAHLDALNAYAWQAGQRGLPRLTAIDEATTEPSLAAVRAYLDGFPRALVFTVAADTSGRIADGYHVQDQPWLALVTRSGKLAWHHDGWLPTSKLLAAAQGF